MKCPGQDTQYWKPGAIFEVTCPQCEAVVEFFKDDTTRKCGKCGHRFLNPQMDFGCASYCQYAEQCLGDLPPELIAQKEDLLKDRVAIEMKRHYKSDFKRIGHATRVARYAERIGKERRGNLAVILCAAYLFNIAHETEGTADGSPVEAILQKLGARDKLVEEVVAVVARNGSAPTENDNYQVVNDAEVLARIEERHKAESLSTDQLEQLLQAKLVTTEGLKIAREVLHLPSRSQ